MAVGHQIIVEDRHNSENPDDRRSSNYCDNNTRNDAQIVRRCNIQVRIYLKYV